MYGERERWAWFVGDVEIIKHVSSFLKEKKKENNNNLHMYI